MSDPFARFRRFLRELKRRNVYKVAVTYAVVAFIVWQAASLLFPALRFPPWTIDFVIVLTLLGFPIALVLAWAFEMTPEGVRRTETPEGEGSDGGAYQWIGLAVVVLLAGGVWYVTTGDGGEPAAERAATTDTTAARTASTARDTAGPPRLAVLPFENIAPDSAEDYFARGMHEEVLNQLSKVSGLEVISRTSVMQYATTNKTVREISNELGGVNALLEGTVRRAGDQLRITTQLIAAPEDEHLWSTTYERELSPEAIFDIQADIAQRIAGVLETQLAEGERERIESAPTDNLAAYDAYLRGRDHFWRFQRSWDQAALDRAIGDLRQAIQRDSTFPEAHALLARAYDSRSSRFLSGRDTVDWADSAAAALRRARAIDAELSQVHLAKADVRDSSAATIAALRRALELQPDNAYAKAGLASLLRVQGEYAEAVRTALGAIELDPRRPEVLNEVAVPLSRVGLHSRAEAWYRRILEIEPTATSGIEGLWRLHLVRGHPDRALTLWEDYLRRVDAPAHAAFHLASEAALAAGQPKRARDLMKRAAETYDPRSSIARSLERLGGTAPANLGLALLRLGHEDRGREILRASADSLRRAIERDETPGRDPVTLAGVLASLGRTDEALGELERVAEEGGLTDGNLWYGTWLFWHPLFDALRSRPRFQDVLQRVRKNQKHHRQQVLQTGLNLWPPGMKPDTTAQKTHSDG